MSARLPLPLLLLTVLVWVITGVSAVGWTLRWLEPPIPSNEHDVGRADPEREKTTSATPWVAAYALAERSRRTGRLGVALPRSKTCSSCAFA
jgi:Na+-transporting methylmalonyl-CoA/oxaloacetate decarboxylase gamma subunit